MKRRLVEDINFDLNIINNFYYIKYNRMKKLILRDQSILTLGSSKIFLFIKLISNFQNQIIQSLFEILNF